jgi:hypothetical protein
MRTLSNRAIAAATAVALGLTAIAATPASASPRRYNHGNAAAIGAAVAIFGTIAAIAAANDRDRDYREHYRPHYGPGYGPYAYEPRPYYGPRW